MPIVPTQSCIFSSCHCRIALDNLSPPIQDSTFQQKGAPEIFAFGELVDDVCVEVWDKRRGSVRWKTPQTFSDKVYLPWIEDRLREVCAIGAHELRKSPNPYISTRDLSDSPTNLDISTSQSSQHKEIWLEALESR